MVQCKVYLHPSMSITSSDNRERRSELGVVFNHSSHNHLIVYNHHLAFKPEEDWVPCVVPPTSHSVSPGLYTWRGVQGMVCCIMPAQSTI